MTDPLEKKTFVFTGEMNMPREEAQQKVIMLGGRVTTAISGKTTHLVAGTDPGPKKMEKAKTLKITVMNEEEFLKMISKHEEGFVDTMPVNIAVSNLNNETIDASKSNEPWCEKYRPTKPEEFVGNSGLIISLRDFLLGKSDKRAALLSGNPGVGKTTAAMIVCNELKLEKIEFNASDTRNKKEITDKIKETLNFYALGNNKIKKKVLIMDEIDGMSSDRGGIAELTGLIKTARIPIICICNDRNNPKIRTLSNYCLDLRFRKLIPNQILPRLRYILEKEGKQIKDSMINEVIKTSNSDLRYCLNMLQNLLLRDSISHDQIKTLVKKNSMKNIFEIASEIFHKSKIVDKLDLYFEDYSFVPLFVQENYLKVNYKNLYEIKEAAESLSYSDLIDKMIHGPNQEWGLLSIHAFYSTINPIKHRNLTKRIDFPQFLGQRSKRLKNLRNLSEILLHASQKLKMNKKEFRFGVLDLIFKKYTNFLINGDVEKAIDILKEYDLLKSDMDGMVDIVFDGNDIMKDVTSKNKGALTRFYKKLDRDLPYNVEETKKAAKVDAEMDDLEDEDLFSQ